MPNGGTPRTRITAPPPADGAIRPPVTGPPGTPKWRGGSDIAEETGPVFGVFLNVLRVARGYVA